METNKFKTAFIIGIMTSLIAGGFVLWSTNKEVGQLKNQIEEARIYNEISNLKSLQDLIVTLSVIDDYDTKLYILDNYNEVLNNIITSDMNENLINKSKETKQFLELLSNKITNENNQKISSEIIELMDVLGDVSVLDQDENINSLASLLSNEYYEEVALDRLLYIDNYPGMSLEADYGERGIRSSLIYDNVINAFKINLKKNNFKTNSKDEYKSIMDDINK